ncbi:YHS domain-containing protein [Micromonospora sp. CPCC 206061]|uniref:YHS domain-containing protein n=1 Tax=Micromonospora sp. CPCC 206061 TaxID=3122410 RepID=UPI002FF2ABC6
MKKNLAIKVEASGTDCSCCSTTGQSATEISAVDPVCGMTIDPATAAASTSHDGQTYYFCAPRCQRAFEKDPASYLSSASQ